MPAEYIVSIADDRDFRPTMFRVAQSSVLYDRRTAVKMAIDQGVVSSPRPVLVIPSNAEIGEGSLYQVVEDVSPPVLVVEGCPRVAYRFGDIDYVVMAATGSKFDGRVEFHPAGQCRASDHLGAVYAAIDSGAVSMPGPVLVGYPGGGGIYSDPVPLFQVVEQPGSTALRVE